ncbi:unnamed protein product, partial [Protopolystoma xenopodis]
TAFSDCGNKKVVSIPWLAKYLFTQTYPRNCSSDEHGLGFTPQEVRQGLNCLNRDCSIGLRWKDGNKQFRGQDTDQKATSGFSAHPLSACWQVNFGTGGGLVNLPTLSIRE